MTTDEADVARPAGMRKRTTKGFIWSFGATAGQAVLQIGSLAVLGRILSPQDYGVVTASMLAVSFAAMLGQLGVSAALVQRKDLSAAQTTAALYFSVSVTIALGVVFWSVAPWLNLLVGLSSSSDVIRILAIQLPIIGLTVVPLGLLQRNLRFKQLAMVDITAYLIGGVTVSIVLALAGLGPYALVGGQLTDAALTALGYLAFSRVGWRPGRITKMAGDVRGLLGFGLSYSLGQIASWIALNGDNFVVANRLPTASLGVYGRAYQLLAQPANLVGGVADKVLFPAMSRVQDDPPRMMRAYVAACGFVALATVPATVVLYLAAPEIIALLLGSKWTSVVAPLQIFALVLLPRTSYKISGSFTRARGAVLGGSARQWLYAGEVIIGCSVGAFWGVIGVAIGASVAICLHWLTMIAFSARVSPGLWSRLGLMYVRYVPVAVVAVAAALLGRWIVAGVDSAPLSLLTIVVLVVAATAAVVLLAPRAFAEERRMLGDLAGLLRRRSRRA